MNCCFGIIAAGLSAGLINGVFGGGGGMLLVPLLTLLTDWNEDEIFPASVSIIFPICVVSLLLSARNAPIPWTDAFPYLIGSIIGGITAGKLGSKIPVHWLHRILAIFIIWGGIRSLC